MKLVVMAIRDAAVGSFMRPIFVQSIGQATRMFADEVNRKADDNLVHHHPEHFSLWHFGDFDDSEAPHFDLMEPECISRGVDVRIPDVVRQS